MITVDKGNVGAEMIKASLSLFQMWVGKSSRSLFCFQLAHIFQPWRKFRRTTSLHNLVGSSAGNGSLRSMRNDGKIPCLKGEELRNSFQWSPQEFGFILNYAASLSSPVHARVGTSKGTPRVPFIISSGLTMELAGASTPTIVSFPSALGALKNLKPLPRYAPSSHHFSVIHYSFNIIYSTSIFSVVLAEA